MGQRPPSESSESEANAAFIVLACNNHDRLLIILKNILRANAEFREAMPLDWEGDELQDACEDARKIVESIEATKP